MTTQDFFKGLSSLAACCVLTATASPVSEWNKVVLDAIRVERTAPPLAARHLALVHAAMFDAVNGVDRRCDDLKFAAYSVDDTAPKKALAHVALAGAAHAMLSDLFPAQATSFDAVLSRQMGYRASYSSRRRHLESRFVKFYRDERDLGLGWGGFVSRSILADRLRVELTAEPGGYQVPEVPAPGEYRLTVDTPVAPLLPDWGWIPPLAIPAVGPYLPPAPPALDSAEWLADLAEVQRLGNRTAPLTDRTADQTEMADFWANDAGTATPPGHWNAIATVVVKSRPMPLHSEARLYALLNLAMADAGYVAWRAKYEYAFWRPITAIREAGDVTWSPRLRTPPHPDYVSGHSAFSGAAAAALAGFFGRDDIGFTVSSDATPTVFRTFTGFWQAAEESGWSRIYGGIHYRAANLNGLSAGAAIGEYVIQNLLRAQTEPGADL
jgi:hypothetical protein